jgi:hypothetical protein
MLLLSLGSSQLTSQMKELRTFDPYRAYLSKQDESQKMFQEVLKKYSSFAAFIEVSDLRSRCRDHKLILQRTKYQTTGMGNIGLRELLMEPVQRIPRYTLLFQSKFLVMMLFNGRLTYKL